MEWIKSLNYDQNGLIPAVAQDWRTGQVLMLAYMNAASINKTLETGKACYYSRSRQCLWLKGETSGCYQMVKRISVDCDQDTLLLAVEQLGTGACHTGEVTCFYTDVVDNGAPNKSKVLFDIYDVINSRKEKPVEGSYTNYLFNKGADKILKKVGEESAEVIIATKNHEKDEIIYETADLLYHLSVNLANEGLCWEDVFEELKQREK